MSVLGWLTAAVLLCGWLLFFSALPSTPPHAANSVDSPDSASPVDPARPMNRRLERRSDSKNSSSARSSRGSCGMPCLLCDDEGVLWVPGQLDLAARPEALWLRAVRVLGDHGQLLASRRLDQVLDRDAEEGRDDDRALQDIGVRGRVLAGRHECDLLGAHADAHRVAAVRTDPVRGHAQ